MGQSNSFLTPTKRAFPAKQSHIKIKTIAAAIDTVIG
jgi:hypothetical protein